MIHRFTLGLALSIASLASHAKIVGLDLTSTGSGLAILYSGSSDQSTQWTLSGLPPSVTISNGDVISATVTFASVVTVPYDYVLGVGSTPAEYFSLTMGVSGSAATSTFGSMALYLNDVRIDSANNAGSDGLRTIYDAAKFSGGAYTFDRFATTFTVSGLSSPEELTSADLGYLARPPIFRTPPPIDPSTPISILPTVPEPETGALVVPAMSLLSCRLRRDCVGRLRRSDMTRVMPGFVQGTGSRMAS